MNISDKNRKHNLAFLLGSLTLAAILFAGSGFFIKEIFSGEVDGVSKAEKTCKEVMRMAGFNFSSKKNGDLQVEFKTERNVESLVFKSGVVMASCPAYTVYDFCAGAGCPTPGLAFSLKLKEL